MILTKYTTLLYTNQILSTFLRCLTDYNCISHFRSFFQSVCVLGYCILPLDVALIICRIILTADNTVPLFIVRFLFVILGFVWATVGKFKSPAASLYNAKLSISSYCMIVFMVVWILHYLHTTFVQKYVHWFGL